MRRPIHLVASAALLALSAGAFAADVELSDAAAVAQLKADLASPSFTVRENAQKRLQTVPPAKMLDLRRIAAATDDEEAKARLMIRVGELQKLVAIAPPDFAFKVANANLETLAAALRDATDENFNATGEIQRGTYTIESDAKQFWEIYRLLNAQDSFTFAQTSTSIGIRRQAQSWDRMQVHDAYAVFLKDPEVQAGGVQGNQPFLLWAFKMEVGLDPRLDVATVGTPDFTLVTDGKGHRQTVEVAPLSVKHPPPKGMLVARELTVKIPEDAGTKLTLVGAWPVQIAEEHIITAITDFTRLPAAPLDFGDAEFVIAPYELASAPAGAITVSFVFRPKAGRNSGPPLEMKFLDAGGKLVQSRDLQSRANVTTVAFLPANATKLLLSYPSKRRDIRVPFEFKDLSLQR